jgi:hypothetical protein
MLEEPDEAHMPQSAASEVLLRTQYILALDRDANVVVLEDKERKARAL